MNNKEINKKILSNPKRRKEVAYHEAGHFVMMGYYCKLLKKLPHVKLVSIKPQESENLGVTRSSPIANYEITRMQLKGDEKNNKDDFTKFHKYLEKSINLQIKYLLGGYATDYIMWHTDLDVYEFLEDKILDQEGDIPNAVKYLDLIYDGYEKKFHQFGSDQSILFDMFEETIQDIKQLLPKIKHVGELLLRNEEFNEDECFEIYESLDLVMY